MKIQIVRGGAGGWTAYTPDARRSGKKIGCGHVPKSVQGDEFVAVCIRQLHHIAGSGQKASGGVNGGEIIDAELSDEICQQLIEIYAATAYRGYTIIPTRECIGWSAEIRDAHGQVDVVDEMDIDAVIERAYRRVDVIILEATHD